MALSNHSVNLPQKSPPTTSGAGYRPGQLRSPPTPYSANYRRAMAYPGRQAYSMTSGNFDTQPGSPTSPDPKRRRVEYGHQSPTRMEPGHRGPAAPLRHHEMPPRSDLIERRGTMAASLQRPFHQRTQHMPILTPLHLKHDILESLPNLKTGSTLNSTVQTFSIDAMVNSIQSVNKVKVLANISPSLRTHNPPFAVRGAVIAVDGAEADAVSKVATHVQDFLTKDEEYRIHVWDGSLPSSKPADYSEYLRLIRDWHWKSQQIIHHITTLPNPCSPTPVSPRTVPSIKDTASADGVIQSRSSETVARRGSRPTHALSEGTAEVSTLESRRMSSLSTSGPMPIALITHFQLSQTDFFASRIPITDSYAPIDHWQWMATLWRGIVGPDITIVVKPSVSMESQPPDSGKENEGYAKEMLSNESVTGGDSKGSQATAVTPGVKKAGVELRLQDARTIVMNSIGDKDLRRVAFEVGEWVRDKVYGQRFVGMLR